MYTRLSTGTPGFGSYTPLTIEVNVSRGIKFHLVGLPDASIREAKQRIYTALKSNGFHWPGQRITVNLAPTSTKKSGVSVDLPIALGILAASGQISTRWLTKYLIAGELGLDGSLRPPTDIYNLMRLAQLQEMDGVLIPNTINLPKPPPGHSLHIVEVDHLKEAVSFLNRTKEEIYLPIQQAQSPNNDNRSFPTITSVRAHSKLPILEQNSRSTTDFNEVQGQEAIKSALMVAAAGGHHMLVVGPPGSGKSLLASGFQYILPPMSPEEAEEACAIHASQGADISNLQLGQRPCRFPKNIISKTELLGKTSKKYPGEIHLARAGTLILDEFAAYPKALMNELLMPLDRQEFQLLALMNPCPCGHYGSSEMMCHCSMSQIRTYQGKMSLALIDRLAIKIKAQNELWTGPSKTSSSSEIQQRTTAAYQTQLKRQGCQNAHLSNSHFKDVMHWDLKEKYFLESMVFKLGLSTRSHHHIMKVARTMADLDLKESVQKKHLISALELNQL